MNDDLISRQAVLDLLEDTNNGWVINEVLQLPPVNPQEPKTGHWRPIYQGDEIIDYRCTECEFGSTFGKSTHGMNFCPKCGCRMIEPQESEDKE